jgi:hypothetical protein
MPDQWVKIQEEENEQNEQNERGQRKSSLIFSVPEGANIFNRRFVIGLSASQAVDEKKGTTGIMLKVNARYLLETMSLEGADGKPGGTLAFSPGTSLLKGVGQGARAEAQFKFWNNSGDKRKFYMRRLWDLYPSLTGNNPEQEKKSREEKIKCYFSGSVEPILWQSWVEGNEGFELKAGASRDLKWKIVVPETAIPGKTYEEIVFLGDETLWTKTDFNDLIGVCRRMAKAAKDQKDKPVLRILQSLAEKDREALLKKAAGEIKDEKEKDALEQHLIECLNKLLTHRNLVEKGLLGENIEKQGELGFLMAIDAKDLKDEELRRLNRVWLEKALGPDVHSFRSFGASGKVAFIRIRVTVADK